MFAAESVSPAYSVLLLLRWPRDSVRFKLSQNCRGATQPSRIAVRMWPLSVADHETPLMSLLQHHQEDEVQRAGRWCLKLDMWLLCIDDLVFFALWRIHTPATAVC